LPPLFGEDGLKLGDEGGDDRIRGDSSGKVVCLWEEVSFKIFRLDIVRAEEFGPGARLEEILLFYDSEGFKMLSDLPSRQALGNRDGMEEDLPFGEYGQDFFCRHRKAELVLSCFQALGRKIEFIAQKKRPGFLDDSFLFEILSDALDSFS